MSYLIVNCKFTSNFYAIALKKYKFNYKESDYIDILKHSSFDTKTDDEIRNYIDKNLYSLDRIYIDKGDENEWLKN